LWSATTTTICEQVSALLHLHRNQIYIGNRTKKKKLEPTLNYHKSMKQQEEEEELLSARKHTKIGASDYAATFSSFALPAAKKYFAKCAK